MGPIGTRRDVRFVLALGLLGLALPAGAAGQHHFNVWGRPQIFDIIPPTVPYVEINAVTFAMTPQTINGAYQMAASCTQTVRLTTAEAQQLVTNLTAWLVLPEEERELFVKVIQVPPLGIEEQEASEGPTPGLRDQR